jgi:hypothetical protein
MAMAKQFALHGDGLEINEWPMAVDLPVQIPPISPSISPLLFLLFDEVDALLILLLLIIPVR